jgi:hypothetical protein
VYVPSAGRTERGIGSASVRGEVKTKVPPASATRGQLPLASGQPFHLPKGVAHVANESLNQWIAS